MTLLRKDCTYITDEVSADDFPLISDGRAACVFLSDNEYPGVARVAGHFMEDIEKVSGIRPKQPESLSGCTGPAVIAGTLGHSEIIDELAAKGVIDVSKLKGAWDSFIIQTAEYGAADKVLVIAGSNKRGTIYGLYDVSRRLGVSPWHWWADVPAKKRSAAGVLPGAYFSGEPKIKYRGFFINDEYPCLAPMALERFEGMNHEFYAHVFELLLRLKGNYLWPAMWNECFHDDDPENTRLADEMGVIMGTSHHEPLMRAWKEWRRYGKGDWNLETNREYIENFWTESVERQGDRECVFTVGMRGDGDEALSAESRDEVLDDILTTQRNILSRVKGKVPEEIPQMWAVYKEVQEYYEHGAKIPDDILVMLCDDNWGNIRKLPRPDDAGRKGGFGLYYHFDYVGGPRNYKWVNTSPLPRVREQLNLAYKGGIDRLWIVNVGDIKPLEFPLSFFLDYAWDPDDWTETDLDAYASAWAAEQFGTENAAEIADCLTAYARINGRRKPELIDADSFSTVNYREAERVLAEYTLLADRVMELRKRIPIEYADAFYELVRYPVCASANLYKLHVLTALNRLYAKQGRVSANTLAGEVRRAFDVDREMSRYYNDELADGKWHHMMNQTHISYTYWQQPEEDVLPELSEVKPLATPSMGVAVEGSADMWPGASTEPLLPEIIPYGGGSRFIEVCNRGTGPLRFSAEASDSWILLDAKEGEVTEDARINVTVDFGKLERNSGAHKGYVTVKGSEGTEVKVAVTADTFEVPETGPLFIEYEECVSIEAEHFAAKTEGDGMEWRVLPGLGKTLSGVTSMPTDKAVERPKEGTPCLEYRAWIRTPGKAKLSFHFSPTNDFLFSGGLRYAVSVDDETPRIINIHNPSKSDGGTKGVEADTDWDNAVADQVRMVSTVHEIIEPGLHRIRYWLVDPGLVLEKLVVWTGNEKASYLGPPESPVV